VPDHIAKPVQGVPFHAGALNYYKAIGLWLGEFCVLRWSAISDRQYHSITLP